MAKANLLLQNGTHTTLEGTPEEITAILKQYSDERSALSALGAPAPGQSAYAVKFSVTALVIYLALALAVFSMAGYGTLKMMADAVTRLYFDQLLPAAQVGAAKSALVKIQGDFNLFVLVPDRRNETAPAISAGIALVGKNLELMRANYLTLEEKEALARFDEVWMAYQQALGDTLAQAQASPDSAALPASGAAEIYPAAVGALDDLSAIQEKLAQEMQSEAASIFANRVKILLAIAVIEVVLGAGLGFWLLRRRQI